MSLDAIEGLRGQIADVLNLTASLTNDEWSAPSACAGWSVQDVIAHMGSGFKMFIDPSELTERAPGLTVEQGNDAAVALRRDWSGAQVREEYEHFAPLALAALTQYQDPSMIDAPFQLGDLGTFTLGLIADALCFDHVVHVHCDIVAPGGPLNRQAPALDAVALGPTLDWMLAGLPQMCQATLTSVLTAPVRLSLTGEAGRVVDLIPASGPTGLVTIEEPAAGVSPSAEVSSSVISFLSWSTKRSDWRSSASITTGDPTYGAAVLDALRVI